MVRLVLIAPPSPLRDTPDPNGMPLGLISLGTVLKALCDVKIVDGYSLGMNVEQVCEAALNQNPDLIGIGIPFSFSETPALAIAGILKKSRPNVPVILGGVQATFGFNKVILDPSIDAVVVGEAERTAVDLMKIFLRSGWRAVQNDPPAGVSVLLGPGTATEVESRPLIDNLDSLPQPDYGLLPGFPGQYEARVMTSRGCTFNCPYCVSCTFWRNRFRAHSPERVVREVRDLKDIWSVRRLSFADDTFNLDPVRARRIAVMMIEHGLNIRWGASCRPELLNRDDLRVYAKAGMNALFLGLESASPEVLTAINRKHDPEETLRIVEFAENLGINVHSSFMIGLPTERAEDVETTLAYAEKLPASSLGFHIFHPLPGSDYAKRPKKYGIEFVESGDGGDGTKGGVGDIDGYAPIRTEHLSQMEILDYYYRARGIAEGRGQR
jgi:anaerobic magnesium-protoporphyrin IX monomethyl ester cyclase